MRNLMGMHPGILYLFPCIMYVGGLLMAPMLMLSNVILVAVWLLSVAVCFDLAK